MAARLAGGGDRATVAARLVGGRFHGHNSKEHRPVDTTGDRAIGVAPEELSEPRVERRLIE